MTVTATITRKLRGIEHAIAITILPVVCTIEMEVGIATCQTITAYGRTIDEKVVLDVTIGCPFRITTHVISGILPVIDQVVHILVNTLHLEVSSGVVNEQDAIDGDVICLHQSTSRVSHQTLSYDTVHEGDILGSRTLIIPVDGEVFVLSPSKRTMVENHVLTIGNTCAILVFRTYGTHAEAHIANDKVVGTRETDTIAIYRNTFARSGLSCYI